MICGFIGAQAQIKLEGGRNPLVDASQRLWLLPPEGGEPAPQGRPAELDTLEVVDGEVVGIQVGEAAEPGEPGYVDPATIPEGSFEALSRAFAPPARR
jgi:hypothetical protein